MKRRTKKTPLASREALTQLVEARKRLRKMSKAEIDYLYNGGKGLDYPEFDQTLQRLEQQYGKGEDETASA